MVRVVRSQMEFEGQVSEEVTLVVDPQPEPWPPEAKLNVAGTSAPRVDGYERVTGRAVYSYDVRPRGMLCGKILRSPYPHARIASIDTSRSELLPGVRSVLSHVNSPSIRWKNGRLLLDSVVQFTGDEVAAVAADDELIAEDAIDLIRVQYEELPFVLGAEEAMRSDAPQVQPPSPNLMGGKPRSYGRGDIDEGWAQAEVTVEQSFRTQTALQNPLEPHGSVAQWTGDYLTVWDSTQSVFRVRSDLSEMLGLPLNRIRVICRYMGGGFGSKQEMDKQTVLAALLSRMSGRAVQIMLSRREESIATGHRQPTDQRIKLGARRNGTLTAIEVRCVAPVGAYGYASSIEGPARKLYLCPNVRTELYAVRTNTDPARVFRAPGYTEGMFALESAMDMLAEKLGMDPLELRLKNYADRDQLSGQQYSSKKLREAYEQAAQKIGWTSRAAGGTAGGGASMASKRHGIGMASQVWGGGGGPPAYAGIKLNPDGTAEVVLGTQDIGTGTRTGLAQVAAEELGIPLEDIYVSLGDTQSGPYAPVSAGSMTLTSVGPAVRAAAEDVRQQLLEVASHVMKLPGEQLEVRDGQVQEKRPEGQRKSIAEILRAVGDLMIVGRGSRGPNPSGFTINSFGAQFAEVEVDVDTGRVRVLRVVAVHDIGRVINPRLVQSQMEGGIIQGVGYALTEERVRDGSTGRVLNPNLEEYLIPTALDVPDIDAAALGEPDPHSNSLGSKGIGEPPIIPTAPAIANAIYSATRIRLTSLPMSTHSLLRQRRSAP